MIASAFQKGHSGHGREDDLDKGQEDDLDLCEGRDPSQDAIADVQVTEGDLWIMVETLEVAVRYQDEFHKSN